METYLKIQERRKQIKEFKKNAKLIKKSSGGKPTGEN